MAQTIDNPTLDADIAQFQKEFSINIRNAMAWLASDTQDELAKHIQEDVYDKFNPSTYRRRAEYGVPTPSLIDMYSVSRYNFGEDFFEVTYDPKGEQEQWKHPLDGDALIRRIEKGQGYEWTRQPPPRPFLQNLMADLVDNAQLDIMLVNALNDMDMTLGATVDGAVFRTADDWDG